jgi:hypothetical protein
VPAGWLLMCYVLLALLLKDSPCVLVRMYLDVNMDKGQVNKCYDNLFKYSHYFQSTYSLLPPVTQLLPPVLHHF